MRNVLSLLAAGILVSCGGRRQEDPKPINDIPANSVSVTVDGSAFPADLTRTIAQVHSSSGALSVTLRASQTTGPQIHMYLYEFQKRTGTIYFISATPSEITLSNTTAGYFMAGMCNPYSRSIEIVEYDETAGTVSGRFSAKVCYGTTSRTLVGQFNLPYTVVR